VSEVAWIATGWRGEMGGVGLRHTQAVLGGWHRAHASKAGYNGMFRVQAFSIRNANNSVLLNALWHARAAVHPAPRQLRSVTRPCGL
jgi:hypothetical protein